MEVEPIKLTSMVLLFSVAELIVWLVFFLVIVFVYKVAIKKSAEEEKRKKDSGGTITFRVYEKPKVTFETAKDEGERDRYSTSIPSNVEEISLVITEKDGKILADVQSVKVRGELSDRIVFLDNVDEQNLYTVTIPPDAGEVNLIIKETDHKISVEVKSVEKKNLQKEY